MTKILILMGSVRPARFNDQPAQWIYELAKQRTDIDVDLIDLAEVNLPFMDEPIPPSQHKYSQDHTKQWAKTISAADGFIFVTPEYNHSYSPVLKNAIDFLFAEWHYKPVTFVSYGSGAGGSRAAEHLRAIAAEIKMYDLREQVMLPNYWEHTDKDGNYQFTEQQVQAAQALLEALSFWGKTMRDARHALAAQSA